MKTKQLSSLNVMENCASFSHENLLLFKFSININKKAQKKNCYIGEKLLKIVSCLARPPIVMLTELESHEKGSSPSIERVLHNEWKYLFSRFSPLPIAAVAIVDALHFTACTEAHTLQHSSIHPNSPSL